MKRITAITMCCLFTVLLCGCGGPKKSMESVIVFPDSTTMETVNGYKTDTTSSIGSSFASPKAQTSDSSSLVSAEEKSTIIYYANKSTKKFHSSTCSYSKSIKEDNLYTTSDREELIKDGYTACKKCNP